MTMSRGRTVGCAFSGKEQAILDLLCSGDHPYRGLAREQLRVASWGGYEFDDCDCFLVSVPKLPRAYRIRHGGGPFSVLEVSRDGEALGHLELWVVDGYLHSADYIPFDDHELLPALDDVNLDLLS